MAGDHTAAAWLHGPLILDDDDASAAVLEEDTGEGGAEDEAPWLPALTTDDRLLVREYMLAANYPRSAVESIDEWPAGELRHLLANARTWRVHEAQRVADRIDSDRQLKELDQRRADSHATLERIYRDQATSLMARDADKSLILLTAREARRSASGNHVDGNPGLELERHLRLVAAECDFVTGPPHWDRGSKRLLIDLYQREAEAWWDSGGARGQVRVWPKGKVLESRRIYRALYPFQRAAVNAAHVKSHDRPEATHNASASERAPIPDNASQPPVAENVANPPLKEPEQLPEPGPSSTPAGAAPPTPAPTAPSPPALARPALAGGGQPAANKPATVPNARKRYKLTLWVSPVTDLGLTDVHGLLQLDGADPIPFCQLKSVNNPLPRALQEAFVAVERARARPPKMTGPAAASPAPPPAVPQPSASGPRNAPHKTTSAVAPAAPAPLSAGSHTPSKLPAAQPSLF